MHPRHPPPRGGRERCDRALWGGCSCDTPATHSELRNEPRQGCSYTVERDRGGCSVCPTKDFTGFVPGTNSVKPWDKPGFPPYFTQWKPGKPGLVPGTSPGVSTGQTRGRRAAQKVYVKNIYVPFSLAITFVGRPLPKGIFWVFRVSGISKPPVKTRWLVTGDLVPSQGLPQRGAEAQPLTYVLKHWKNKH